MQLSRCHVGAASSNDQPGSAASSTIGTARRRLQTPGRQSHAGLPHGLQATGWQPCQRHPGARLQRRCCTTSTPSHDVPNRSTVANRTCVRFSPGWILLVSSSEEATHELHQASRAARRGHLD